MGEKVSPGEARAEAYRLEIQRLQSAVTTGELLAAADWIGRVARQAAKRSMGFVNKMRKEGIISRNSNPR
jgi:hypothetical protein